MAIAGISSFFLCVYANYCEDLFFNIMWNEWN